MVLSIFSVLWWWISLVFFPAALIVAYVEDRRG